MSDIVESVANKVSQALHLDIKYALPLVLFGSLYIACWTILYFTKPSYIKKDMSNEISTKKIVSYGILGSLILGGVYYGLKHTMNKNRVSTYLGGEEGY